ncbi:MAG: glycosyltransferase [Candidatus Omnitrophota bacterium]
MKVAIIHDWLTGMRGGEKCLEVFCELFPQADVFTLLYNKGSVSPTIARLPIKTSFIQHLPLSSKLYRNYLPLFPKAIESFDLKEYDFILSSSHCVAKGAKKSDKAFHLCYCYTPMRYVWSFFDDYFGTYSALKKIIVKNVSNRLKKWDLATLGRVDEFVAISETIQNRIKNIYQRESAVIYPPVDVDKFFLDNNTKREDFYLCVCALVPYKRIDVIIDAFNRMSDKKLIIVGDGNLQKELKDKKTSNNISFLGWVGDKELLMLYQKAKAFVYMAEEDFGIAAIEAQSAGLPVIAYGKGGLAETIAPLGGNLSGAHPTGLFFKEQKQESLLEAIESFEAKEKEFSPEHIRKNALRFSREVFKDNIKNLILRRNPWALREMNAF